VRLHAKVNITEVKSQ